jgi:hypothetical protein
MLSYENSQNICLLFNNLLKFKMYAVNSFNEIKHKK